MRRAVFPAGHPDLAVSLKNLGLIVKRRGHLDQAEASYWESLEITRKALGDDNPDVAVTLMNLGGIYRDCGEYAKAEPLPEDALARDRKVFLSPNVALVRDMTSLAQAKEGLKKYVEAEALLREASAAMEKTGAAPDHGAYGEVGQALGSVLIKEGKTAEVKEVVAAGLKRYSGKVKSRASFEKLQALLAGS